MNLLLVFGFLAQRTGEESASPLFYSIQVLRRLSESSTLPVSVAMACVMAMAPSIDIMQKKVDKKGQALCYLQDHQIKIKGKARKK